MSKKRIVVNYSPEGEPTGYFKATIESDRQEKLIEELHYWHEEVQELEAQLDETWGYIHDIIEQLHEIEGTNK